MNICNNYVFGPSDHAVVAQLDHALKALFNVFGPVTVPGAFTCDAYKFWLQHRQINDTVIAVATEEAVRAIALIETEEWMETDESRHPRRFLPELHKTVETLKRLAVELPPLTKRHINRQ